MKAWQKWLIAGSVLYAVLEWKRPHWYEDLMCRAYAPDYLVSPGAAQSLSSFETASAAAAVVGLPVGWLIDIASHVQPGDLTIIAAKIRDKVLAMGPPPSTTDEALAAYKAQAIAAGGDFATAPPGAAVT